MLKCVNKVLVVLFRNLLFSKREADVDWILICTKKSIICIFVLKNLQILKNPHMYKQTIVDDHHLNLFYILYENCAVSFRTLLCVLDMYIGT